MRKNNFRLLLIFLTGFLTTSCSLISGGGEDGGQEPKLAETTEEKVDYAMNAVYVITHYDFFLPLKESTKIFDLDTYTDREMSLDTAHYASTTLAPFLQFDYVFRFYDNNKETFKLGTTYECSIEDTFAYSFITGDDVVSQEANVNIRFQIDFDNDEVLRIKFGMDNTYTELNQTRHQIYYMQMNIKYDYKKTTDNYIVECLCFDDSSSYLEDEAYVKYHYSYLEEVENNQTDFINLKLFANKPLVKDSNHSSLDSYIDDTFKYRSEYEHLSNGKRKYFSNGGDDYDNLKCNLGRLAFDKYKCNSTDITYGDFFTKSTSKAEDVKTYYNDIKDEFRYVYNPLRDIVNSGLAIEYDADLSTKSTSMRIINKGHKESVREIYISKDLKISELFLDSNKQFINDMVLAINLYDGSNRFTRSINDLSLVSLKVKSDGTLFNDRYIDSNVNKKYSEICLDIGHYFENIYCEFAYEDFTAKLIIHLDYSIKEEMINQLNTVFPKKAIEYILGGDYFPVLDIPDGRYFIQNSSLDGKSFDLLVKLPENFDFTEYGFSYQGLIYTMTLNVGKILDVQVSEVDDEVYNAYLYVTLRDDDRLAIWPGNTIAALLNEPRINIPAIEGTGVRFEVDDQYANSLEILVYNYPINDYAQALEEYVHTTFETTQYYDRGRNEYYILLDGIEYRFDVSGEDNFFTVTIIREEIKTHTLIIYHPEASEMMEMDMSFAYDIVNEAKYRIYQVELTLHAGDEFVVQHWSGSPNYGFNNLLRMNLTHIDDFVEGENKRVRYVGEDLNVILTFRVNTNSIYIKELL